MQLGSGVLEMVMDFVVMVNVELCEKVVEVKC